jgi:hypothetical protein
LSGILSRLWADILFWRFPEKYDFRDSGYDLKLRLANLAGPIWQEREVGTWKHTSPGEIVDPGPFWEVGPGKVSFCQIDRIRSEFGGDPEERFQGGGGRPGDETPLPRADPPPALLGRYAGAEDNWSVSREDVPSGLFVRRPSRPPFAGIVRARGIRADHRPPGNRAPRPSPGPTRRGGKRVATRHPPRVWPYLPPGERSLKATGPPYPPRGNGL